MSKNVGYIRVSSTNQNTVRQLVDVKLDKVFTDRCSGAQADRPALTELLEWVREEDVVHVHSMDRLARNLQDLKELVAAINDKGASVKFHKESLEFSGEESPMSELLLNLLGAVAQFERALIKERQREGIEAAKKRGAYKGRKKALCSSSIADLRQRRAAGEGVALLARKFGISRQTVYSYLSAGSVN
jgi:DNA invertase Pin-like site-specific DNA recombinase